MLLKPSFFRRHPVECARELLGCELRWGVSAGVIVETEAYCEMGDEACHTFFRPSAREFVASHDAGCAYVYLNYGMHWLANVLVKSRAGNGFVLLRALEPTKGLEAMRVRRRVEHDRQLCSGPAKLTQALGIDGSLHGQSLCRSVTHGIHRRSADWQGEIVADVRIGISSAKDLPWRFCVAGCPHLSRRPGSDQQGSDQSQTISRHRPR